MVGRGTLAGMRRRTFLHLLGGAAGARLLANPGTAAIEAIIQTVRGPVPAAQLGLTLPHEHVLVDFIGADQVSPSRYDADEVFDVVRPHLEQAYALGVRAVFECTPAFLARDPALLRRLSEATGLHIVTNTGLYGAQENKFLPAYAHTEKAAGLANRWIAEARDGVDGTGVRPGFIKCGVDATLELSVVHRKLVEAAALTHAETGLTIAIHTGRGPGLEQLDVLGAHGVAPAAFVWVHAQNTSDDVLFTAADRGAWLSFDGLNTVTLSRHLHLCREMKRRGHLSRVLLSHDAGWFDPAKPDGGTFRSFDLLFKAFLPMLRGDGFGDEEIDQLLVANPAQAFSVRKRPL